jgi:hypothetical protein
MIKTTTDKLIITRENDKVKEDALAHLSDRLLGLGETRQFI